MNYARAIIAAVLATGLVIGVIVQELGEMNGTPFTDKGAFDRTLFLLSIAIIILLVPDAIEYVRFRRNGKGKD